MKYCKPINCPLVLTRSLYYATVHTLRTIVYIISKLLALSIVVTTRSVSYTHLDVYKRQIIVKEVFLVSSESFVLKKVTIIYCNIKETTE